MAAEEQVGVYDADGREVTSVPRSRMRAENLRHGATAVVVRDDLGRVYVHRRTTTKDVYPGLLDFAAGGVLQAGENPYDGAVREAAEELGVQGVPLVDAGEADYADRSSTYRAFRYITIYDGPIRWQPEEVSWGDWFTVRALCRLLAQTPDDVVPDSRALWAAQLTAWNDDRVELEGGWDNRTCLVEGRWVDRSPRHDHLAPWLLAETRLLPTLVERLPIEVPVPVVVEHDPLVVRHRLVPGAACDPGALTREDGQEVGRFLRVLHDLPGSVAAAAAVRSAADDIRARDELVSGLRSVVLPLMPPSLVAPAERLLDRVRAVGAQRLCHGDLVREHLLVSGGKVSGVIDWGDARVTDPAVDLAWALHGTTESFARQVTRSYGLTPAEAGRAAQWFALVPWHALARAVTLSPDDVGPGLLPEVIVALQRWNAGT
ncbi:MAG: phosphotransferase [Terracoccus sp.]